MSNPDSDFLSVDEKNDRLFKVRGASAVAGSSRMVLYCEANPDRDDERITSVIKFNSGAEGKIISRLQLPSRKNPFQLTILRENYDKKIKEKPY